MAIGFLSILREKFSGFFTRFDGRLKGPPSQTITQPGIVVNRA
jgi:hypothetical protein